MKSFFALILCVMFTAACVSSNSEVKKACVKIYEEGIEQIQKADSPKAISDISYEIAKKLADIGNSPEGEQKLSADDRIAIYEAETKFYQAIEKRSKQLIPNTTTPTTQEPIIRTTDIK